MIGIYRIVNLETGESYVGQSKNINNRIQSHISDSRSDNPPTLISKALKLYGIDKFEFQICLECSEEYLDYYERKFIDYYNSIQDGYNLIEGGQDNIGNSNPNAKINEKDVFEIRESYKNHERKREVYEKYKDKLTWMYFSNLWEGASWTYIHMDVYTEENKIYYSREATNGENSPNAMFTNEEVLKIRQRYVYESAKSIYKDFKDRCKFQTFQQILWGRNYKDLPIYDKKRKVWFNT